MSSITEIVTRFSEVILEHGEAMCRVEAVQAAPDVTLAEVEAAIQACEDVARRAKELSAQVRGVRLMLEARAASGALN